MANLTQGSNSVEVYLLPKHRHKGIRLTYRGTEPG